MGRGSSKGSGRNRQQDSCCGAGPSNVTDAIVKFMETTTGSDTEITFPRHDNFLYRGTTLPETSAPFSSYDGRGIDLLSDAVSVYISCSGHRECYLLFTQCILTFMCSLLKPIYFPEREHEIKILRRRLKDVQRSNADLLKELDELRERETRLQEDMESEREAETLIQQQLYNLFLVPTTFYITPEVEQDSAETVPVFICLPDGS